MLPPLDARDNRALIQELKEMLPFYTPEWRFSQEDPDAGTALFLIFARMFDGTIKRFNQVPRRNMAAFLNMMDVNLLPARPASAYLTFKLSSGDAEPVMINAGTQALAQAGGEQVVFETETNLLVTPAVPAAIYTCSGQYDRIVEVPAASLITSPDTTGQEFALLDGRAGENRQEHCFYLGETDLFNISGKAALELEISRSQQQFMELHDCELLADSENTEWSYQNGSSWYPFNKVAVQTNRIVLLKQEDGQIDFSEVNGVSSRWICCRVKPGKISELKHIALNSIDITATSRVEGNEAGLEPDLLFYNDIPQTNDCCYPFGEFFSLYDTFYLASQEAFTKKKANISLSFKIKHEPRIMSNDTQRTIDWKMIMKKSDLKEPERPNIFVMRVVWEYWNGISWVRLFKGTEYEDIFFTASEQDKTVSFMCPEDMESGIVNNQLNYWIRARILSIHNIYAPNGVYQVPRLESLSLHYQYEKEGLEPTSFLSLNNLAYQDHVDDLKDKDMVLIHPLRGLELNCPVTYLGFERPPLKGPISIFWSLREQKYDPDNCPALEWEYSSRNLLGAKWVKLDVTDRTNHLSNSGLVSFSGPPDFSQQIIFGNNLYWLRLVNYDGRFDQEEKRPPIPVARGLYMNTTRVMQRESAASITLANPRGEANLTVNLPRTPIVAEEVWVDEFERLDEQEKQVLLSQKSLENRAVRDEWGNLLELWVKWCRVDDLALSGASERHYTIDYSSGWVCFGDNCHGLIPPRSKKNNIEIKYWVGGGSKGNVAARDINLLRDSIPYIDSVFNPQAACGGCDRESFDEVMHRGPQSLKHGGRAVTSEDFETMAREVSRNVARVKCLPNTNWKGERESGCLTLVVLPRGGMEASLTFPSLKQEVEKYIYQHTSGNLMFPGKMQVIEPLYLEISALAILVTNNIDSLVNVENEALTKIKDFIQPKSNERGWNIGEYPHISVLYTLLKSISEVSFIENITMTVHKLVNGERIEIDPNQLGSISHGYIINGEHQVKVKTRN